MRAQFNQQRRDPVKSTCTLAGAAAVVSAGGRLDAFAAGGVMPLPQAHGIPFDCSSDLPYRVASDKIPAEIKHDTVEGTLAFSAVCTHLGCMLSNWDAATKQFLRPCHDALLDPLSAAADTDGGTSRTLPRIPVNLLTVSW